MMRALKKSRQKTRKNAKFPAYACICGIFFVILQAETIALSF
jgi:hypothetical protein